MGVTAGAVHAGLAGNCRSVREIMTRIGDKWSMLVVMTLREGPMRFNGLRRSIDGVSQRMLTLTLRGLERDGFVTRTVHHTVPPQVEYELTALGASLVAPVSAIGEWAVRHQGEVEASRARYDAGPAAAPEAISGAAARA